MGAQYRCKNRWRRAAVRDSKILNGIDYLEVLDREVLDQQVPDSLRQRILLVRCLAEVPAALTGSRVSLAGGVRVTPVRVRWACPANQVNGAPGLTQAEKDFFTSLLPLLDEPAKVLAVRTDSAGDYSTYRLSLTLDGTDVPPFDPQLAEVEFSFKVECPSEFDCRSEEVCPPEQASEPVIDYLAKDYASFRRLMLDRLAVVRPDWQERHPADLGVALVEVLAYAADHLSYYQDAVATEAYLGTARLRTSVRRHARLLDYPMHDGCNARVWVALQVGSGADGAVLPGPDPEKGRPGATLLTQIDQPSGGLNLADNDWQAALSAGALVFETLHDLKLWAAHNEMYFHTWGDDDCCLPRGATCATLKRQARDGMITELQPGDVLIFEEARSPETGKAADADPARRHVVRLTAVEYTQDPLDPDNPGQAIPVVEIAWAAADALPFPLCLRQVVDKEQSQAPQPVAVVRGNVILADHGRTISGEELPEIISGRPYRPTLQEGPITQQGRGRVTLDQPGRQTAWFDPQAPAATALRWEKREVLPAIRLADKASEAIWLPQGDLLSSDRFATEFVVEVEDDGRAALRFGDGVLGSLPVGGLQATYRIGNGRAGNVGARAIAHVITGKDLSAGNQGIIGVRNPLPAQGGADPEPLEQVRLYAPQAFRTQERAVTEADYAAVAERHPEVQKAAATRRWTGSWYTMFVTVDRRGGQPVDPAFKQDLRLFLDGYRLAGYDVEVDGPLFVSLDLALTVCVAAGHFRSNVKQALLEVFSNRDLPDGRRGFFHPDNFTFQQPVYLSRVLATAMQVPGVAWVDADDTFPKPNRFQRWGQAPRGELLDGRITLGRLEIARLDNDPNRPENGKLEFFMQGGM